MAKRATKRRAVRSATAAKPQPKADRPFAPGYGIVGPKDGKGVLPCAWVGRKMNRCRTFWLATIRVGLDANHTRPHVMPIWGVWVDDAFFFSTGRKSRKGQNLAANPACSVANDDGQEAVIVEGLAIESRMRRNWSALRVPTRRNTRWIRGAWKNRFFASSPAAFSDSWKKPFRSPRRGGGMTYNSRSRDRIRARVCWLLLPVEDNAGGKDHNEHQEHHKNAAADEPHAVFRTSPTALLWRRGLPDLTGDFLGQSDYV
jgi:hypothetical protein